MINIKKFDKNVGDYESIYSGNSLYFIVGEVDRYIEEKMAISTQILLLQKKTKDVLTKYLEVCDKIKNLIERVTDKPGKYGKDFMKIKFNSDDNLPLNKTLKLHNLTLVVRSVFLEDNRYYPQFFQMDACTNYKDVTA